MYFCAFFKYLFLQENYFEKPRKFCNISNLLFFSRKFYEILCISIKYILKKLFVVKKNIYKKFSTNNLLFKRKLIYRNPEISKIFSAKFWNKVLKNLKIRETLSEFFIDLFILKKIKYILKDSEK